MFFPLELTVSSYNWVPKQCLRVCWVNESPPASNLYRSGKQKRGYLFPPPLSFSFLMLMRVRSSIPGTICPSSGSGPQHSRRVQLLVCVQAESGDYTWFLWPNRLYIKSTSLDALCSGTSTVCSACSDFVCDVIVSNR